MFSKLLCFGLVWGGQFKSTNRHSAQMAWKCWQSCAVRNGQKMLQWASKCLLKEAAITL
jgi:hypothetical protein